MMRSFAAVIAASLACGAAAPAAFFEDDYDAARVQAERSKKLLAVEVWAPW